MGTHCHQGCSEIMWSETADHKPSSALGSQIRSFLGAKLLKCCMEPITVIMPTTSEHNVRLQDYITAFSRNTRVSWFSISKSTSVTFLPPPLHCPLWIKRESGCSGAFQEMEAFDQTELPAWILLSPLATRKVGCIHRRPCCVDGGWHALAVDHLAVNSARLPNIHCSPKTPSWARAPVFSQHGRHVNGDRCLGRKDHGNFEMSPLRPALTWPAGGDHGVQPRSQVTGGSDNNPAVSS